MVIVREQHRINPANDFRGHSWRSEFGQNNCARLIVSRWAECGVSQKPIITELLQEYQPANVRETNSGHGIVLFFANVFRRGLTARRQPRPPAGVGCTPWLGDLS
jgi:hypothetical protein